MTSAEESNPWQTLLSEVRYDNPWITVTQHQVINPSGGPGIYGTVHFKNLAIGVIVLDDDNYIWLVGQYRYPLSQYSWEIPEGGGALDVEPLESAKRELKEETGIEAAAWRPLVEMHLSNSVTDEHCLIFLATELTYGRPAPEDTEQLALKRLPFDEAYRMVVAGEITDSLSVTAILRLRLLLSEGK